MKACVLALLLSSGVLLAQQNALQSAVDSLRGGQPAEAEATLRKELHAHGENPDVLGLLAVVCDQENKYSDADALYTRAAVLKPNDPALLNNYGNHLIATGKKREAEQKFRKVLVLQPAHVNARIQLAELALQNQHPADAELYLTRLSPDVKATARVAVLEMRTSYALGHRDAGEAIASRLLAEAKGNLETTLAVGAALSAAGQYPQAKNIFSDLAADHPSDARVVYDLGLIEAHLGEDEKALAALTQARSLEPKNVSALYDLAVIQRKLDHLPAAAETLADATQIEPGRADAQRLLAQTLAELGFFPDAIASWTAYLKLQPDDEGAQRDRAFAQAAAGSDKSQALDQLTRYVVRHPGDAAGQYELGLASAPTDLNAAETHLNQALRVQPNLAAAHMARGLLLYKKGENAGAEADFEAVLHSQPRNVRAMQRLAQCETAAGKNTEALNLLQQARAIDPDDGALQLALGRALLKTGDTQGAAQVFKRARELGPARKGDPGAGFLEFVKLPPEERAARYRAGVKRAAQQSPADVEAQVRYLQLVEKTDRQLRREVAARIVDLKPSAETVANAAGSLLAADEPDVETARILIDYGTTQYPADASIAALAQAAK